MPTRPKTHRAKTRTSKPSRTNKRADPFYKTARWLRFRRWFLAYHPLCADPFGYHAEDGQTVASRHVDHIVPRRDADRHTWYAENACQGLCHSCHSRKTAQGQ